MILSSGLKILKPKLWLERASLLQRWSSSQGFDEKYTESQKEKILKVINESDSDIIASYDITKTRLKKFNQWKESNGSVKNISDVEFIDGFTEKTAGKLFKSILEGPTQKVTNLSNKIKGQILQPTLSESVRQSCQTVLSLFIAVNSVSWTLIEKKSYRVVKWQYHGIDYPDGKRSQITDIFDIAWKILQKLPEADIYVMKAEPTTLRAAGSDPNNPKVIAVNLQKAQLVAMVVALINSRAYSQNIQVDSTESKHVKQHVYFLRPTLPFRLYGTLIGNEKVSTEQTVEMLLKSAKEISPNNAHVNVPENLQNMFSVQKDLQKDMLGHCLLLALTFMDLCIYRNQEKINKLISKGKEDCLC